MVSGFCGTHFSNSIVMRTDMSTDLTKPCGIQDSFATYSRMYHLGCTSSASGDSVSLDLKWHDTDTVLAHRFIIRQQYQRTTYECMYWPVKWSATVGNVNSSGHAALPAVLCLQHHSRVGRGLLGRACVQRHQHSHSLGLHKWLKEAGPRHSAYIINSGLNLLMLLTAFLHDGDELLTSIFCLFKLR